ncbi:flagellar motor switch protein FliG [Peptoclostridium litorale DSM 5388]|uniref:Flagellar motor switch protein FliG n=1 Tax=Peptoclostridium litorale DSM 5388 TaxID=1121324 RepID=A0A069RG82_PEPLI|nr:flagellar motor switch protein FliG [Peptoclostridium litorale]KDR95160.1 flagellar motor switch protein FliG [Peptoclostridium litorale DSM 5388]SIN74048.1 flagellar motor switch protein FliG [Peptoclostridium litorale DSM 5388]
MGKSNKKQMDITGKQKAAILLITLGPEYSARIFRNLSEDEIEELTLEIANIKKVEPELKDQVLEEFYEICLAQEYISEGGINYAQEVLEKALGNDKAIEVIGRLTASLQVRPFDFARKADPSQLMNFIQNEHPQTIALILSHIDNDKAAQIISGLSQEKQSEVAKRIATMDRTYPEMIKEIESVLEDKLSNIVTQDYTKAGGVQDVVDILNSVDRGTEKRIMENLEMSDPELADEIKRRMFLFEDIINLDSTAIQRFIREVDNNELAVALKGATQEVGEVIFTNMSKRMSEMIKEDMDFMGPVRLRDVEEAQQKIVNIIRKLEDQGEIIISRGGGDELIV